MQGKIKWSLGSDVVEAIAKAKQDWEKKRLRPL